MERRRHVSGGSSFHWSRPTWQPRQWSVGGHIYVGTTYYPRPYYYYTPEYVPSYYGTSYYPVAPAAEPSYVVVPERPDLPKLGLGLFAGGSSVQNVSESTDMGLLGRLRLGNGGLLIVADEAVRNADQEQRKPIWVFDIRLPSNPVAIATCPIPSDLDYVANTARPAEVRYALCNCIGFGSKNSALVVKTSAE